MPLPRPSTPPIARRGVYHVPFLGPNDERYVVAVDRLGHISFQATVYDVERLRAAEVACWQILDRDDPLPVRVV